MMPSMRARRAREARKSRASWGKSAVSTSRGRFFVTSKSWPAARNAPTREQRHKPGRRREDGGDGVELALVADLLVGAKHGARVIEQGTGEGGYAERHHGQTRVARTERQRDGDETPDIGQRRCEAQA